MDDPHRQVMQENIDSLAAGLLNMATQRDDARRRLQSCAEEVCAMERENMELAERIARARVLLRHERFHYSLHIMMGVEAIDAVLAGNARPAVDVDRYANVRAPGESITGFLGRFLTPDPEDTVREPLRPHRIEGGAKSCAYCGRVFTFNMMRNPGPDTCDCAQSRAARGETP